MFKNNFLKSENYFTENYFEIENFSESEANLCTDKNNKPIKNCKFRNVTMHLQKGGYNYPLIDSGSPSFIFKDSLIIDYDNGSYDITFIWNLGFGGDNMVYKARGILNKEGTKMSYFTVGAELPNLFTSNDGYPILLRGDIDFCSKKLVITQYDENTDESGNVTYTESVKPLYNQGVSDMYKNFYIPNSHKLAKKPIITINDILEFRGVKEVDFVFNLGDETCVEPFKNEIKMEQFSNKQDNLKELCDGLKPAELMIKGLSELEYNKNLPLGQTYGIYSKFCLSDPAPATALEDAPAPAPSPDPPPTWLNKKINVIAKGVASMAQYSFTRLTLKNKSIITTFKISVMFIGNFSFDFESTKGKMTFPDGTKYTKYTEDLLVLESSQANLPFLGITDIQLNINFRSNKMTLKSVNEPNSSYLNNLAQNFGLDTFDISLID